MRKLDAELHAIGEEALPLVLPLLAHALGRLQRTKIKALASAALFVAVEHGSLQAAAQLIRDGADVNSRRTWGQAKLRCTPLFIAAATGHPKLVELLLSAKQIPVRLDGWRMVQLLYTPRCATVRPRLSEPSCPLWTQRSG